MNLVLESIALRAGRQTILDGVSFGVESGEFCALIGPTGCGKTTLLRVVDLLLRPSSGRLLLDGVDHACSHGRDATAARRRMSMVMQRPCMLSGSVHRNVEFGLRMRGIRDDGKVAAGLEAVGLGGFAGRRARTLSGGEMQKAALARALVTRPEILLLDEPLSSVDQGVRPDMRSLIRSLHREMGMTVVMATHDLTDALALADRVAVIADGRVVQHGTVDEVILKPSNLFVASFSGLRNIMRASFEGTIARVGELEIVLAEPATGTGCIAVPPEAVTLSRTPPDSSQRNCFPGNVLSVEPGLHVDIVNVEAVSIPFAAAITRESTDRLDLQAGTPVWVSFKANSVRILT